VGSFKGLLIFATLLCLCTGAVAETPVLPGGLPASISNPFEQYTSSIQIYGPPRTLLQPSRRHFARRRSINHNGNRAIASSTAAQSSITLPLVTAPLATDDPVVFYKVKHGDTLSSIARKNFHGYLYGFGGVLPRLLDKNNHVIRNPNLIFPGQIVRIDAAKMLAVAPQQTDPAREENFLEGDAVAGFVIDPPTPVPMFTPFSSEVSSSVVTSAPLLTEVAQPGLVFSAGESIPPAVPGVIEKPITVENMLAVQTARVIGSNVGLATPPVDPPVSDFDVGVEAADEPQIVAENIQPLQIDRQPSSKIEASHLSLALDMPQLEPVATVLTEPITPSEKVLEKPTSELYQVLRGDTLSSIARSHYHGHLYGGTGVLTRLLDLNNDALKNPDLIFPGQWVRIEQTVYNVRTPASLHDFTEDEIATAVITPSPSPSPVVAPAVMTTQNAIAPVAVAPVVALPGASPTPELKAFEPSSFIALTPGAWYSRVDAKDLATGGTAHILSNLYPSINLTWEQHWTKDTQTHLSLGLAYYELEPNQPRPTSPDEYSLSNFEFGFLTNVSDRLHWGLGIRNQQEVVIRATSLTALSADRIQTVAPYASLQLDLAKLGKLRLAAEGDAYLLLPGQYNDYSLGINTGWTGKLLLEHQLKETIIQGAFTYGQTNLNSNISNETMTQLGFELGLAWRFGN